MKITFNTRGTGLRFYESYDYRRWIKELGASWNHDKRFWACPINYFTAKAILSWPQKGIIFENGVVEALEQALNDNPVKTLDLPIKYSPKTKDLSVQSKAKSQCGGNIGYGLFMDMGCGKTKTSLDIVCERYLNGELSNVIVFCPLSLHYEWDKEINLHVGVDYEIYHILSSNRREVEKKTINTTEKLQIFIIAYEAIRLLNSWQLKHLERLACNDKFGIICDEAHRIKNSSTNTYKQITSITKNYDNCNTRIALTGTPATKNIVDYYSILKFINDKSWPVSSKHAFMNRYTITIGDYNNEVVGLRNENELYGIINQFSFSCKKEEVLDLPEKVYIQRHVKLTDEQVTLTKKAMAGLRASATEVSEANLLANALARLSECMCIASGFHRDENKTYFKQISSAKLDELKDIVEGLPDGKQAIIWCSYTEEVRMIKTLLIEMKESFVEYFGGIPKEIREENKQAFIQGDSRFFIATTKTASVGLTLVNCDYVIYYSNSFSLVDRAQSEDRCHRIGQKNNVTYIDIISDGIDSKVYDSLQNKLDFVDRVHKAITSSDGFNYEEFVF